MNPLTDQQVETLTALANGILPADDRDSGAAEVQAGFKLAADVEKGKNASVFLQGIEIADSWAQEKFGNLPAGLNPDQIYEVLLELKSRAPGFYKQLRADVSILYLSDAAVWERIGFPGPSAETGGYPDFDQPQSLYGGIKKL
jgi:hypothetical protein